MKNYCLLLSFLILMGCSKDESITTDCINTKLEELEMVEYSGQEIGCNFFLELYYYKNQQYFLLGNHCADMISYPNDCNGNIFCENSEDANCRSFYNQAVLIGIVGVSE